MKKLILIFVLLYGVGLTQNSNLTPIKETYFSVVYNDIKVENNLAYITTDSKFMIFDVTDKTNPNLLSFIQTDFELLEIYLEDNISYISAGSSGVVIIDVYNKRSPQLLKILSPTNPEAKLDSVISVTKIGSYLFVTDFNKGIKIFDISDPINPTYVKTFLSNEFVTKIEKRDVNRMYLTVANKGFYCYNIASLENIVLVGQYLVPANSVLLDFAFKNNTAYVTDYYYGIRVLNITNPANITQIALKNETVNPLHLDVTGNVLVSTKRTITSLSNFKSVVSGFDIYSVNNETNPTYQTSVNVPNANNVSQDLNHIYLTSLNAFRIYDIININQPKIKYNLESFGEINDVLVAGNYAFLATSANGLVVTDISTPSNPQFVSNYTGAGGVYGLAKRDTLMYLACDSSFQIVNVKNVNNITKVGSFNYDNYKYTTGRVSVTNDSFAVVVGGNLPGISLLRIKNKSNIVETDRYGYGIVPYSIFDDVVTSDTNVFAVNHYNGFYVLSVNPNYTFRINAISGEGGNAGISYDNLVYIASGTAGMKILSVQNLYQPSLMSTYSTEGDARSIFVMGNSAIIANGYSGIDVADVSNPYVPIRVARYNTNGIASRLFVKDSYVYLAEKSLFSIYQYQDMPVNITLVSPNGGEIWKRGSVRNITWTSNKVQGNVNILISFNGGLSFVDTIASDVTNNGLYEWYIPLHYPLSSTVKIKIESINNTNIFDISDNNFTLSLESDVREDNQITYSLSQNYPNPFNPSTKINYSIAKPGNVKIEVFDILGNRIKTLVDEFKQVGNYTVNFNAQNLSSGIYIYRIQANDYVKIMKMNLLK